MIDIGGECPAAWHGVRVRSLWQIVVQSANTLVPWYSYLMPIQGILVWDQIYVCDCFICIYLVDKRTHIIGKSVNNLKKKSDSIDILLLRRLEINNYVRVLRSREGVYWKGSCTRGRWRHQSSGGDIVLRRDGWAREWWYSDPDNYRLTDTKGDMGEVFTLKLINGNLSLKRLRWD